MSRSLYVLPLLLTVACGPKVTVKEKADVYQLLTKAGTLFAGGGFGVARDTYTSKVSITCPRGGSMSMEYSATYTAGSTSSTMSGAYSYNGCSMTSSTKISGTGKINYSMDTSSFTSGTYKMQLVYDGTYSLEDTAAGTKDDLVMHPLTMDISYTSTNGKMTFTYVLNGTVDANGVSYVFTNDTYTSTIEVTTTVTP